MQEKVAKNTQQVKPVKQQQHKTMMHLISVGENIFGLFSAVSHVVALGR